MIIMGARVSGSELILTLGNPVEAAHVAYRFKAGEYEIKPVKKKRSLDANALMWTFCEKIAKKIGSTKEDVYREQVRQVGVYYPLPIREEAVKEFQSIWSTKGIGWFADEVDDSKLPGYKLCFAYAGSSTYDTEQMSRLIDNLLQDALALDIETKPQEEIENLLREWRKETTNAGSLCKRSDRQTIRETCRNR